LQAGGAEAIDGHRARFDRQTGAERGNARDVHALFAFGMRSRGSRHQFPWRPGWDACERFLDGESGEIVGARGAQRAFVARPTGVRTAETMTASGMVGLEKRKLQARRPEQQLHCWASVEKKQIAES